MQHISKQIQDFVDQNEKTKKQRSTRIQTTMSRRRFSNSLNNRLKCNSSTSESSINDAIQKGYFQQVRFLIELGYSVNEVNRHGRTPLMSCALVEDEAWGVGLARLLLEKGAALKPRDKHGLNALHYACIYERIKLVETFLRATDFNLSQQDRFGNTALHYSATNGNTGITEMLICTFVKYKRTVDTKNALGVTPLLQAWKHDHPDCARMLIELGGADQYMVDPNVNKCSRDYEIKLLAKENSISQETLKSASTQNNDDPNLPRYMKNPSRSKTRARSAPASGRNSHNTSLSRSTSATSRMGSVSSCNENINCQMKIISKEDICPRLYRNAGLSNPRNMPERVFNSTPLNWFLSDTVVNGVKGANQSSLTATADDEQTGWRHEVKSLFNSYDFQWSGSYRKSIIPPPQTPPSLAGEEEDELLDLRPMSPNDNEASRRAIKKYGGLKNLHSAMGAFGEGLVGVSGPRMGRRSSVLSTGGRSSRRGSTASVTSLLLSEPHSGTSSESSTKKKSKSKALKVPRKGSK